MTTKKKLKLGVGDSEFRSDAEIDCGHHYHSKRIKEQGDAYSQINDIFRDFNHEHVGKENGNIHVPLFFNSSTTHIEFDI